jgi:hypothetical protein
LYNRNRISKFSALLLNLPLSASSSGTSKYNFRLFFIFLLLNLPLPTPLHLALAAQNTSTVVLLYVGTEEREHKATARKISNYLPMKSGGQKRLNMKSTSHI